MCQFTIENQGMQSFLVYTLQDGEELDQACYEIIHSKQIQGLLPTFLSTKEETRCLKFNITSRKSLNQYFDGTRKKDNFIKILSGILAILKHCEECTLDIQYVVLRDSCIFINEKTLETELLFCPVINLPNQDSIREQFIDLILHEKYASTEKGVYVSRMANLLEGQNSFPLKEMIQSVEEIRKEKESEIRHLFHNGKIKMPVMNLAQTKQPEPAQFDWVGPGIRDNVMKESSEQECKDNKNVSEQVLQYKKRAVLIREKTREQIVITNQVFKIGKERNFVDYCIVDNPTISRSHANIVIEDEEYYIMDMNSKNRTFVNGRMIHGGEKRKLIPGSKIQLSDETFEFSMEL